MVDDDRRLTGGLVDTGTWWAQLEASQRTRVFKLGLCLSGENRATKANDTTEHLRAHLTA
ncbi:hypothetical protein EFS30_01425 [Levilactobacillus parabrevis]|nr:hypothetical protein [Levilactobacillus parabrevis]MCT4489291.1 hypothetical protein [Levilactobacillus parabrevis]